MNARPSSPLSAHRLAALASMAPIGIFHADGDGRVRYFNERWTAISGFSPERSEGHGWLDAIHPDDLQRVLGEWRTCITTQQECISDCRLVRPSGEVRFVHVRLAPVDGSDDLPAGFIGTVEDVTEWRAAERELSAAQEAHELSRRRLQALFDYSLDAIVLTNDDAQYVEANPAACELFGYSRDELLRKRALDVIQPELHDQFRKQWHALLSTGEQAGEYALLRADGTTRTVEVTAVAHVLPGTHLAILRDITDRQAAERARQHYVKRLEILSEIDKAILGSHSPSSIASAVVGQIGRLFPATRSSILLFDASATTARIAAVWSTHPSVLAAGRILPLRDDTVSPHMTAGQSGIFVLSPPRLKTWIDRVLYDEGIRSYLRVPLRTSTDVIGSLNISANTPAAFNDEHLSVAQEVADRMAVAITNARLFAEVQSTSERITVMSQRLQEVQEAERREIARELHDEIGQTLTALKLRLDLVLRSAPPDLAARLDSTERLVDDLVSSVRRLSLDLRPPLLDEFGLGKALESQFERFTAQTGVAVTSSLSGLGTRLPIGIETAAYRIVQESLTNVARHARVNEVEVAVEIQAQQVVITVTDRGVGFDTAAERTKTAGLTGMHERVALLGGVLQIESAPGKGTTIHARIPATAAERRPS